MIELITELVWFNPSIQQFLSGMLGLESIRFLVLEHLRPSLRSAGVLKAVRQLLLAIQSLGHVTINN